MAAGRQSVQTRSKTMSYEMDDNRFGKLVQTGTPISIHKAPGQISSYYQAMNISHQNYLACIGINGSKPHVLVQHMFDPDLNAYMDELLKKNLKPLSDYCIPSKVNQATPALHSFVPKCYKLIFKSLYTFVFDMHKQDRCLTNFGPMNIVFVGDVLKFVGIGFAKNNAVNRKADFECIRELIEGTILDGYTRDRYPEELQNLMELHRKLSYQLVLDGFKLVNHFSLIEARELLNFFVFLHEGQGYFNVSDGLAYDMTLNMCCNNEVRSWPGKFENDSQLSYIDAFFKSKPSQDAKYNFEDHHQQSRTLIRAIRNMAVHLKEYGPSVYFSDEQVAMMIMNIAGKFIVRIQASFKAKKLLSKILSKPGRLV